MVDTGGRFVYRRAFDTIPEMNLRTVALKVFDGLLYAALGVLLIQLVISVGRAQTLEGKIRKAYQDARYQDVIDLATQALKAGEPFKTAAPDVIESYMALGRHKEAGELALTAPFAPPDPSTLNRIAMFLQTGTSDMMDVGVKCLQKAVEIEPENLTYLYDLGLLYWNSGQTDKAKAQCELVVQKDPGNVQAMQILERIAKSSHAGSLDQGKFDRRRAKFRLTLPDGKTPHIAGSWSEKGECEQLTTWKRVPMTRGEVRDGTVTWTFEKDLVTSSSFWFGVLASDSPEPFTKADYFCRFPAYPISKEEIVVDLNQHPVFPPTHLLVPQEIPPGKAYKHQRTYLLCIDSATWNVFMPFAQAGMMPHFAKLMKRGTSRVLHMDPPVSTVAFDILNFGTVRGFSLTDVLMGGVGVLKERGINLLNYGDIKGTEHTWKYLAMKGMVALYASWQEQLEIQPGGKEITHSLDLDPDKVEVAGMKPGDRIERLKMFLLPEDAATTKEVSASDEIILSLYDQGVKKFYQGLRLLKKTDAHVTLAHVGFVDVSYHQFWDSMDSELTFLEPDRKLDRRYKRVIEGIHRLMDQMLGDLVGALDLSVDTLVIFSDHGATGGFAKTYYGHDPAALMVIAGPGVKENAILTEQAEMVDLVPTICHRLGVEPPRGYPGKVMTDLFPAKSEEKPE